MSTETLRECAEHSVKAGAAVGGFMGALATALVTVGSVIGAPVTGGASLAAGAAAAGTVGGFAAAMGRKLIGKQSCHAPVIEQLDKGTSVMKGATGFMGGGTKK